MANNYGYIEPPVSIHDLQKSISVRLTRTVAGETQTRYSDDLGVLCGAKVGDRIPATDGRGSWTVASRSNINRWARYKPERSSAINLITHEMRKYNHFGLDVPFCGMDLMNTMVYDIMNWNVTAWEYLAPRGDRTPQGGIKEYYRLRDFARVTNDITDPFYGTVYAKGYRQDARVPFNSWMDMTGVTEMYSASMGTWFEVNKQISNVLTILFQNSIGDDLHLQDFITLGTDDHGRCWRPVLQVFDNDVKYDEATGRYLEWYERSYADFEACGPAITADAGSTIWSVSLDLSDFASNPNKFFHLCIGIGYVNDDFSSWGSNNSLFLLPFSEYQEIQGEWPFYYIFSVASHQTRKLRVTALSYFAGGLERWVDAGGQVPYFTIHELATGAIRLTMTITKEPDQKVDFIPQNGTPDTGYDPLILQVKEMIQGESGETTYYLNPTNSSWSNQAHTHVDEGARTETVTLYATMSIANIPLGGYGEYHIFAYTGANDEHGNPVWDNIGYFSIHKIPYSNN